VKQRDAAVHRNTKETDIRATLNLDGSGVCDITTGIPFFDHMLNLMTMHGHLDVALHAKGDLEVDLHHTVEDVGLVLGSVINEALGDRKGISRFGQATIPMDDALATVVLDLSKRPFLVYQPPIYPGHDRAFGEGLAKEFFRALSVTAGMNLHIIRHYGENEHHMIEAIFKAFGRSLNQATRIDDRIQGVPSSKGIL
jgi:imidazoleglycerol-phosphate dehydratase